ncbi:hypothetical protein OOJ09_27290 [Mesorhizobium qingshengii]|uniref:Pentapeptide MXKDX repeat protein n=1 Tax=Mesorhizobium qingshengii TaxID=1165689 RepID=A0ABT4R2A5_9HYPH|nr:hypothetical protein [Mesorhizobium qingshengii]MCZ8547900.1 hypothetical protein [Mesorhizobium qingshengii]
MITKLFFVAAVFLAVAGAAQAQSMNADCTEDNMTKMQSQIDSMTSESQKAQKQMAMADMEKAKASMQTKDMKDCKAHMEKAMKAMMPG